MLKPIGSSSRRFVSEASRNKRGCVAGSDGTPMLLNKLTRVLLLVRLSSIISLQIIIATQIGLSDERSLVIIALLFAAERANAFPIFRTSAEIKRAARRVQRRQPASQ